jgi:diguanylate cyclase (GGDEF)-like protein
MIVNTLEKKQDFTLLKTINVLFVEDDKEIQEQLSLFLKRRLGVLITADNGSDGLAAFKRYQPDVVITDIRMPVMNGLEMAKAIKELDKNVPIIVTTAHSETNYLLSSIEIGIDKYVPKPTDPRVLIEAIYKSATNLLQRREIEAKNREIQFILDINPSFIVMTTKNEIEYINQTFLNFLGYSSLDNFRSDHKRIEDFFIKVDDISYPAPDHEWVQHIINNPNNDHIIYLHNSDSGKNLSSAYIVTFNKIPEIDKYIFSFADITKTEKEKRTLKVQALTDSLTGLYNRFKYDKSLGIEIERNKRYKNPLSLIMFDIDYFKRVNDTYGHQAGDDVLRDLATIMRNNIRQHDILGRLGGEEFGIITPETNIEAAQILAEKLRKKVEKSLFCNEDSITCSFGVTQFKVDDSIDSFVKRADDALYKAKKGGRNKVEKKM